MADAPCKYCDWWKNPDRPHETFLFVLYEWDIDEAKAILAAAPRDTQTIPLSHVAKCVDWPRKDNSINLFSVYVDAAHVSHVDASIPLIVGWFPRLSKDAPDAPRQWLIIDGHHRIAKAIDENRETLSVYVLTPEESDSILTNNLPRASKPRKNRAKKGTKKDG